MVGREPLALTTGVRFPHPEPIKKDTYMWIIEPIGIYIFLITIIVLFLISKFAFYKAQLLFQKFYKTHPQQKTWFSIGENSEKLAKYVAIALIVPIISNIIRLMLILNYQINHPR